MSFSDLDMWSYHLSSVQLKFKYSVNPLFLVAHVRTCSFGEDSIFQFFALVRIAHKLLLDCALLVLFVLDV